MPSKTLLPKPLIAAKNPANHPRNKHPSCQESANLTALTEK